MPVKTQYDASKNLFTLTFLDPFTNDAVMEGIAEINKHYSPTGQHFYLIVDLSDVELPFSELMVGMQTASRGGDGYSAAAPNQTSVLVGTDTLVQMAADAYAQEQYGGASIKAFGSIAEAKAHIDELRQG
jgi:hypothetical protein